MSLRTLVEQEVPAEWAAELAVFSPPTTLFSWLKLVWEPGHPWESAVERYVIYEMMPARAMDTGGLLGAILEQLQHPVPPREMGNYYDSVLGTFVRNPDCLITERAYWLFRETACWGRPFWVIQGTGGGHKRWFSPLEKKCLKLAGLPAQAPDPGDLPYAPFDQRTIAALTKHDLLQATAGGLASQRRLLAGTASSARLEADERRFRVDLVKWLANQVTDIAPDVTRALRASDGARSAKTALEMDREADLAEQRFIETGRSDGCLISP